MAGEEEEKLKSFQAVQALVALAVHLLSTPHSSL